MPDSDLIEITSFICTLTIKGYYLVFFFFHPKSPQGAQLGVAVVAAALMDAHLLFTNMTGYILHSQKPQ